MTRLNKSFLSSPSKKIALVLFLALGVGLSAAFSSPAEQRNISEWKYNTPMARRSQNIEIAPNLLAGIYVNPTPQAQQITPAPARPDPSLQLMIHSCGGQTGHANFRSAPRMVSQNSHSDPLIQSVIPHQSVVELTGQFSGEWIGVWWNGATGYIHRCWR